MATTIKSAVPSPSSSSVGEFSKGKTIFVLAIVIGCFAILWPKIFYPMLTASLNIGEDGEQCCDVISDKDVNVHKLVKEICGNILNRDDVGIGGGGIPPPAPDLGHSDKKVKRVYTPVPPPNIRCRNEILKSCGIDVMTLIQDNPKITKEYKTSLAQLRSYNTSQCLKLHYSLDFQTIGLPRRFKDAQEAPSHMRPERPIHFARPEVMHPAMREKGSAIPQSPHPGVAPGVLSSHPQRTLEKDARPGPFPGVRPTIGGAGFQASQPKGGSGTMGIIMPIYTIAIVVFFVYTIMKILFRKSDDKPPPMLKDFGMDPQHRKFVFAEEYQPGSERSIKDPFNKEDREVGIRRRPSKQRFQEQRSRLESQDEPESKSQTGHNLDTKTEENQDASSLQQVDKTSAKTLEPALKKSNVKSPSEDKENQGPKSETEPKKKEVKILDVPSVLEHQSSAEVSEEEVEAEEVEIDEEEDEEEEEEDVPYRPPTPPKSKKHVAVVATPPPPVVANFAQLLSGKLLQEGENQAATLLSYESRARSTASPPLAASVVNVEGSLELENGRKLRSPTPPNVRTSSMSPVPPPPAPAPEIEEKGIPSIYLKGRIPAQANKVLVSGLTDSPDQGKGQEELQGEPEEEAEEESMSVPVVLSGKVTLSVIAGIPDDQPTEAGSISYEDFAKAEGHLRIEDAPNSGENKDEEGEGTHYTTAERFDGPLEANETDGIQDETAEDISALDGLDDGRHDDILPSDDEELEDEENEDELSDSEEEGDEEEEEGDEEDEEEASPIKSVTNKGPPV